MASNANRSLRGLKQIGGDDSTPPDDSILPRKIVLNLRLLRRAQVDNGERMQSGNTKTMIFKPEHLFYYLSQFMTLEAGDLISTGTLPGVGPGMKPQRFVKAGDECALSIDGLGAQRQKCINA